MKKILFLILLALVLLFSACTQLAQGTNNGLHAWMDAPRDRMTLPLKPYTLVFHGNDPAGIAQFEISINGAVLSTVASSDTSSMLTNQSLNWVPSGEGEFIISVRAQNTKGEWSTSDQVTVIISDSTPTPTDTSTPEITFTFTPTFTVTPTFTLTPTLTPTVTPTPNVPQVKFLDPRSNIGVVYTDGASCGRKTVDFYVTVQSLSKIQSVSVKYRLVDPSGSQASAWKTGNMYVFSDQTWLTSVTPDQDFLTGDSGSANDYRHYSNARLEYTFMASVSGVTEPVTFKTIKTVEVQSCAASFDCSVFTTAITCNAHSADGCYWFPAGDSGICGVPAFR